MEDPLIITNVPSKYITQNLEMSLQSSDYKTKQNLLWIIFYWQLLIYSNSQVYDLHIFVQDI